VILFSRARASGREVKYSCGQKLSRPRAAATTPVDDAGPEQSNRRDRSRLVIGVPGRRAHTSEVGTLTYNPTTDMYGGSAEVFITAPVNPVVDAQGHFDTDVVIPAGTAPQTINVQLILPDGKGHMVRASVT
jgi:hypothetical protein